MVEASWCRALQVPSTPGRYLNRNQRTTTVIELGRDAYRSPVLSREGKVGFPHAWGIVEIRKKKCAVKKEVLLYGREKFGD